MKKSIFIVAVLSIFVVAQTFGQLRFGVRGGLNFASMSEKNLLNGAGTLSGRTAFHVGGIVELGLPLISLESGLLLSSKGAQMKVSQSGGGVSISGTSTLSPLYLEVPVHAILKINLVAAKIRLFAGPYIAFGIGGDSKNEFTASGLPAGTSLASLGLSNSSAKIKYGSTADSDLTSTDFGLDLGAGVEISKFVIQAQYGIGLSNLQPAATNDESLKNKVFAISLGYMF